MKKTIYILNYDTLLHDYYIDLYDDKVSFKEWFEVLLEKDSIYRVLVFPDLNEIQENALMELISVDDNLAVITHDEYLITQEYKDKF